MLGSKSFKQFLLFRVSSVCSLILYRAQGEDDSFAQKGVKARPTRAKAKKDRDHGDSSTIQGDARGVEARRCGNVIALAVQRHNT